MHNYLEPGAIYLNLVPLYFHPDFIEISYEKDYDINKSYRDYIIQKLIFEENIFLE